MECWYGLLLLAHAMLLESPVVLRYCIVYWQLPLPVLCPCFASRHAPFTGITVVHWFRPVARVNIIHVKQWKWPCTKSIASGSET